MHHSKDKSDEPKDTFYEELELVFGYLLKYRLKIVIKNLMQKWGGRDIFKQTTGNERLHYHSKTTVVRLVKFNTSKSLVEPPLMERPTVKLIT
jgi:hypothetical protein